MEAARAAAGGRWQVAGGRWGNGKAGSTGGGTGRCVDDPHRHLLQVRPRLLRYYLALALSKSRTDTTAADVL